MITMIDKKDYSDRAMRKDPLTEKIISCCFRVHKELGPGFNERIYQNALEILFEQESLGFKTERMFNVFFQGQKVGRLKLDLLVEDQVIVELKAVTGIVPKLFESQLISYLKVTGLEVGLLINFGNRKCSIRRLMLSSFGHSENNHRNQKLNQCNQKYND